MRIFPSFLWKRMTRIISPQSKILNIWHFLPKEEGKRFSVYNSTKTQMAESGGSLSENFLRQFRDKVTCMLMSDEKHNDDDDGNDESFYKSTFKVNLWIHSIFPDIWSDFFDLLFVPNVYFNVPLQKYKIWPQNIPAWTVSWPHDPACEAWRLWPSDHDDDGLFFHAQALYSVYGKRAYGILAAYHEDHDNDDGFDDDDTPLFSGLKGADSIVCSSIHGGERSAGHLEAIQVFLIFVIIFQQ